MPPLKRWILKAIPAENKVQELATSLNINKYLAAVLLQRGVNNFEDARAYFRPLIEHLHNPFLMKDMQKAIDRITLAIDQKEKILIYGDYDVDGTTSVSLVYSFFSKYHPYIDYYIPDRHIEGYGISYQGINYAEQNGISLIIALDCGIKSVDHVKFAKEKDIDFIICDHHNPGSVLPDAIACLDPKQIDCPYPYKELSGCGVGFKLLQAFSIQNKLNPELIYEYLDLVAISIASDIVPITGENRIMTYFGLKKINERKRPGVKALIEISGFKKDLTVTNLVFGLGPRINAAGRIKHGKASVQLLISETDAEAQEHALELNQKNLTRRDLDSGTLREAIAIIENNEESISAKSTVLFKNDWHKGVIGIVASKCIEHYYRPTIILTESNEKATGSARTVEGFDLYEAICECSDLLEQFGGHTHAAGLTLKLENIPAFRTRFEEVVSKRILPEQLTPVINIDMELPIDSISDKFHSILSQMEPFGPQNLSPVFVSRKVIPQKPRLLKDEHLKFCLVNSNGQEMDVLGFGMSHCYDNVLDSKPVDICYSIEMNEFNNQKSIQLMLKDLKCSGD